MKNFFLILILSVASISSINSQTSKWGLSYAAEFTKAEIKAFGETASADFTVNNINIHYSILSWASDFQIGPLVSMRFGSVDGESFSDFQVGLNLGYNFDKFALVMDTYKVFQNDLEDHNIWVFKPALEYSVTESIAAVLGYAKYGYTGDWRENNGIDEINTGGLLVGVKYKF